MAVILVVGVVIAALAANPGISQFEVDGDVTTGGAQDGSGGTAATLDFSESIAGADDGALTFSGPQLTLTSLPGEWPVDNPLNGGTATFFRDDLKIGDGGANFTNDRTTFTQGSKQNHFESDSVATANSGPELESRTEYPIVAGSVSPNKVDLFDVLTYTQVDLATLQADVVIGLIRTEDNGSANYSIEINAVGFEDCPETVTDPDIQCITRTEGDVLINADITQGGVVDNVRFFRWDLPGGIDGGGDGSLSCGGNLSGPNPTKPCPWEEFAPGNNVIGVVNQAAVPEGEWGNLLPNGTPIDVIVQRGMLELFVDFDALGLGPSCPGFAQAHVKSRSSGSSADSTLQDLAGPFPFELSTCGRIVIEKETIPDEDPNVTLFPFDVDYKDDFSLTDDGSDDTGFTIDPGTYSAAEVNIPTGYRLTDISCTDPDGGTVPPDVPAGGTTARLDVSIDLDPLETVTCTFTNSALGNIIIKKETIPDEDPNATVFGFDVDYSAAQDGVADFTLMDDGSNDSGQLLAGTYHVDEIDLPAGYRLTDIDCDDETVEPDPPTETGDGVTIALGGGETVTCTFTNTKDGRIIIKKETNPDENPNATEFDFDVDYTAAQDGVADFSLMDDGSNDTGFTLKPGTYNVAEIDIPEGWALNDVACDDETVEPSITPPGTTADTNVPIAVAAGETVTCTFTNWTGAIKILKTAKDASAPDGESALEGASFEVKLGDAVKGSGSTDANGELCIDGLTPGATYTVVETSAPANYAVASPDSQDVTVMNAATCASGTPDEVSFVNTPLSAIRVVFTSSAGDGVTVASISCVDGSGTPLTPDAENGNPDPALDDTDETYSGLLPNDTSNPNDVYTCEIVIDP